MPVVVADGCPSPAIGMARAPDRVVTSTPAPTATPSLLLQSVRDALLLRHYSPRTVEAYIGWVRRFVLFHDRRHPRLLGGREVSAFLSDLASRGGVSASTQNQAL